MPWQRILDVNLNRLTESLKFVEDFARFSIQERELLYSVRKIRQDFLKVKKNLPIRELIFYRKSDEDLGRPGSFDHITTKNMHDLVIANLARLKESLRITEEILKLKDARLSQNIKELRFRIYDLEKKILEFLKKKFDPRIYAILDEKYLGIMSIKKLIETLEQGGVTMLQLRIKNKSDREFFNWAEKIKRLITRPVLKFIINNRIDIAFGVGADGVHLGRDDLGIKIAREMLGNGFIIGASAHNIKEARNAQNDGADYLGVGAVFKTKTKKDAKVCGLDKLKAICKAVKIPVVGIGGIDNKNYHKVFRAGASGIAICSYLFEGNLEKNLQNINKKGRFDHS